MKVWITNTIYDCYRDFVLVHPSKQTTWDRGIMLCRKYMGRLLRDAGVKLPKHGSDDVVCVELTAKAVK